MKGEDNYPFADRKTPMNRYLINFGVGTGIALIIGFQRCYEFITFRLDVTKPTLVSFISCAALFLIFAPILIWRHGFSGLSYIYKTRSWLYLIFALLEIQGSYMYNFAIAESSIYVFVICGTIGIFTLLFSKFILNTRYKPFHLIGSLLCFIGVLFVSMSEFSFYIDTNKLYPAIKCIFCAAACVPLYSLSYVSLEAALRQFSIEEVLTFYGLYGMVINALTIIFIDSYQLTTDGWNENLQMAVIGFLITVACRSVEIVLACILILSSNAVYYTHSKLIQRFFYAFLTKLGLAQILPPAIINWQLMAGGISFYVGILIFGVFQMPVNRDRTILINFFRRP